MAWAANKMDARLEWRLESELQLERLKLDMLASLARSERALARIAESVADMATRAPQVTLRLKAHADAIAAHERQLALRIATLLPASRRAKRRSLHPAAPWLHPGLRCCPYSHNYIVLIPSAE